MHAETPTAANHRPQSRWANFAPTSLQLVRQAMMVNSTALTPKRMYLLTDRQLLFPEFRTSLMKPAMPFLDHVHLQIIIPRLQRGHDQGDFDAFAGRDRALEHAGPALAQDLLVRLIPDGVGDVMPGRLERAEVPRSAAGVAHDHAILQGLAGARLVEKRFDFLEMGVALSALV